MKAKDMKKLFALGLAAVAAWPVVAAWKPASRPLMTEFGAKVTPENAWREYPRPQLVREKWTNLNGLWDYTITQDANKTKGFPEKWDGEILVPYALEAGLSGVGRMLHPNDLLWYRRMIEVRKVPGERTILHFDGVDFQSHVFLNGVEVSDVPHIGGQVPFSYDITDFAKEGENELVLMVWDPTTEFLGAVGKQVLKPGFISYTRMSGIWQTVWMENVPETHVTGYYTTNTDLERGTIDLTIEGVESAADRPAGAKGTVVVESEGREVAKAPFAMGGKVTLRLPTPVRAWSPDSPSLYTLKFKYGKDSATGYFAMRKFEKRRDANGVWRFYLNGKHCFFFGTLDQGWWPESLLTPPSEEAMKFDIQTLKDLGFNMMRKHIKVEPARYYWLCDTMGLMVLQDMPSGGGDRVRRYGLYRKEFKDVVDSLRVFPSIVMWEPYNEGWGQPGDFLTASSIRWIKRYDGTDRLVDGPSGWDDYGCDDADAIDLHKYRGPGMYPAHPARVSLLGEFGGIGQNVAKHLWDTSIKNTRWEKEEAKVREGLMKDYRRLSRSLETFVRAGLAGAVYTQTTDVEFETNGFLTYDRKVFKFDREDMRKCHEAVYAAAEKAAAEKVMRKELFPCKSEWAYTFEKPADGWEGASFDDASWKRGKGGFGGVKCEAQYSVEWTTPDLWARRRFTIDAVQDIKAVTLDLNHDDDIEIFVNGKRLMRASGRTRMLETHEFDLEGFKSAAKDGENVIAVHVLRKGDRPCFDMSLATY